MKRKRTPKQKTCAMLREEITELKASLQLPGPPLPASATLTELKAHWEMLNCLMTMESDGTSTLAKQLIEDGIELPKPEGLTDTQLHDKLWQVINGMAKRKHYLCFTNHLSDRQLYTKLWCDTLNQATHDMTDTGNSITGFDLSEDSDENGEIYVQYYACEMDRREWQYNYPDIEIPPAKPLVSSRDKDLPSGYR